MVDDVVGFVVVVDVVVVAGVVDPKRFGVVLVLEEVDPNKFVVVLVVDVDAGVVPNVIALVVAGVVPNVIALVAGAVVAAVDPNKPVPVDDVVAGGVFLANSDILTVAASGG